MRIPLEWLKEYTNLSKSPQEIGDSFTYLGLLLDKPVSEFQKNNYKTSILDLEHRMDRADWLSIIGCARDLAAFEKSSLKIPPLHKEPGKEPDKNQMIKIEVKCPDLVRRFNTRVFRNIQVGPSPDWLKNRLEAYGIPSINNIVDITNYVMVEFGQPMHAQDINKLKAPEIVIRRAKNGEKMTTLLGETVDLTSDQFVLTQAGEPTVLGGIVGGSSTGVDLNTTDIVLDAGNYNQNNIRKSSRQLKIQNETVLRYDKFLDPELATIAMERAVYLILELAGGEYYQNTDWYPNPEPAKKMTLRLDRLEKVGGQPFDMPLVKEILQNLGYKIINETPQSLELEVPYFRTDVIVEDDLVADILRINNYNKLTLQQIEQAPPKEITPKIYRFEERLRDYLTNAGLHEHITNPLVTKNEENKKQVVLENALTSDKSALRTKMSQTLKKVAELYEKHGKEKVRLFEIGKIYLLDGNENSYESYHEIRKLAVININQTLSVKENSGETKMILASLLSNLGITDYRMEKNNRGVDVLSGGDKLGEITTFGFDLLIENLMKHQQPPQRATSEWPVLTTENLSLVMDLKEPFGPIYQTIKNFDQQIVDLKVLEEYTGEEIGQNKKTVLVKVSYKTSDNKEIRQKLLEHLSSKFSVEHRD